MSGYYNLSYGAYTFTGLTILPPQREINASEQLTESWRFRKLIVATSMTALDTAIEAIRAALRQHDLTCVVARNGNTVVTTASNAGYNTRCSVRKIGMSNDLEVSQEIEVGVTFTLPMTQTTSDVWGISYAGRKAVSVKVGFSPARRRTIAISCVYTQTAAATAKQNYDSTHGAWTAAILAKASAGGNMQDRLNSAATAGSYHVIYEDVPDMNRVDAEVRVTTVFQELLYDDDDSSSGAPKKNEALVDATWSFARAHGSRMGRGLLGYGPGPKDQPVKIRVNYSAHVSWAVLNSGNKWGLHEIFSTYIRGVMLSRARAQLDLAASAWIAIVGPLGFDPTPSSRTIAARMEITFIPTGATGVFTGPGAGGQPNLWLEYDEEINEDDNAMNQYRKELDGRQDNYDTYSPGRMVKLVVTQTALTYGAEASPPPRLSGPWKYDGRTKRIKSWWDDTEDTRASADNWSTEYRAKVYLVTYTTRYTLVVASGRTAAGVSPPVGFVLGV